MGEGAAYDITNPIKPILLTKYFPKLSHNDDDFLAFAVDSTEKYLFVSICSGPRIVIMNIENLQMAVIVGFFYIKECACVMNLDTIKGLLFAGLYDGDIEVYDVCNPKKVVLKTTLVATESDQNDVMDLIVDPTRKRLFSLIAFNRAISIWDIHDLNKPKYIQRVNLQCTSCFTFDEKTNRLFVAFDDGKINVYQVPQKNYYSKDYEKVYKTLYSLADATFDFFE